MGPSIINKKYVRWFVRIKRKWQ